MSNSVIRWKLYTWHLQVMALKRRLNCTSHDIHALHSKTVQSMKCWWKAAFRLSGPSPRSGQFGEETNVFPLSGIEPRLLSRPRLAWLVYHLGYFDFALYGTIYSQVHSQSSFKKRLRDSSCLSVCLSAWKTATTTGQVFIKYFIWNVW